MRMLRVVVAKICQTYGSVQARYGLLGLAQRLAIKQCCLCVTADN